MKVHFKRRSYPIGKGHVAELNWERNLTQIPRVGDHVVFSDPESPFPVTEVVWNMDQEDPQPDVWVFVR